MCVCNITYSYFTEFYWQRSPILNRFEMQSCRSPLHELLQKLFPFFQTHITSRICSTLRQCESQVQQLILTTPPMSLILGETAIAHFKVLLCPGVFSSDGPTARITVA